MANVTSLVTSAWMSVTTDNGTFDNATDDVTGSDATLYASTPIPQAQPSRLPGLVDDMTKDTVIEIVNCYFLPVVFVFGVAGNVMSFVVLLVHGMNNSTNVLLTGVTVSDFLYLVTMYTRKVSCIVSKFDYVLSLKIERGLLPTVYMVNRIFGLTTPFLTMLITLERCLAVSMPLKVQTLVTALRMKIVVAFTFLFATVAQFPFFFVYTINWVTDKTTGEDIPVLAGTPFFYENFDIISDYNNIVLSSLFNYGPITVVIVCTTVVLATIKRSARWRKMTSQGGDRPEEGRMTKLLMTVVAVYIICYIPRCAALIANSFAPDTFNSLGGRYGNLFYLVNALQLLLFALNSSCNFVIYMVMSRKFFNTYRRIFLCQKNALDRGQATSTKNSSLHSKTNTNSSIKGEKSGDS
nr:hypothetical protein BaRGS_012375 [Batillaria attramentaria]